jgi:hypothetical protein
MNSTLFDWVNESLGAVRDLLTHIKGDVRVGVDVMPAIGRKVL